MKTDSIRKRAIMRSLAGAGALLLSFVWVPSGLSGLRLCWFRRLAELPCPGCGLTRSFCAISHGQFADAWSLNPFGYVFYALAVLLLIEPLLHFAFPALKFRIAWSRVCTVGVPILVGAMLAYGIWRLLKMTG